MGDGKGLSKQVNIIVAEVAHAQGKAKQDGNAQTLFKP